MKIFLKSLLLFSFFLLTIIVIDLLFFCYKNDITQNDIPALNFSDSYSFNEKIRFIKTLNKEDSIFVFGSSMSLNNLHSQTVLNNFNCQHYLNTSSWGMTMCDNYRLLKSLSTIYKIKKILMVSNIVDFKLTDKKINFEYMESYLNSNYLNTIYRIADNFDLNYYMENAIFAKKARACLSEYWYLKFDKCGTINLNLKPDDIDKKRWNNDYLNENGSKTQYKYLDSISNYCKNNKIELIIFQSPLREGIMQNLNQTKMYTLNNHINKVDSILKINHQVFVDSNNSFWPDSLFADAIHFNKGGAKLFTEFCFNKIKLKN